MSKRSQINSDKYWDQRFRDDWEQCAGPQQSRFFARLAVENLPAWLLEQVRQQKLTFADWGCAQGDGTDMLASYLDPKLLTGVDFSDVAITEASKRYPAIKFSTENWLEAEADDTTYDIVFSSNTLEHFHQPYDVLQHLVDRAQKAIVLALPYREMERIDEHFYTFLPENVPLQLSNDFRLVWSRVVDCRELPETEWPGEQIVLVYAKALWFESLKLLLGEVEIAQTDTAAQISSLEQQLMERDERLSTAKLELTEHRAELARLNVGWAERDRTISDLQEKLAVSTEDVAAKDAQLSEIAASWTWQWTAPFRSLKKRFQRPAE